MSVQDCPLCLPLFLHVGAVLDQGIHHHIALVEDKGGFVGLILSVVETLRYSVHWFAFGPNVRIANVSKANTTFTGEMGKT